MLVALRGARFSGWGAIRAPTRPRGLTDDGILRREPRRSMNSRRPEHGEGREIRSPFRGGRPAIPGFTRRVVEAVSLDVQHDARSAGDDAHSWRRCSHSAVAVESLTHRPLAITICSKGWLPPLLSETRIAARLGSRPELTICNIICHSTPLAGTTRVSR